MGVITTADLTADYQRRIDDIKNLVDSVPENLKPIFRTAMALFDVKRRSEWSSEYLAHGLKAMALCGYYYDRKQQTWVDSGSPIETEEQFKELYSNDNRVIASPYDIYYAEVDIDEIKKLVDGEQQNQFELGIELAGEQQTGEIEIPEIPISPNADLDKMTKGDKSKDRFLYAYSDSGISKNKRNWRPIIMDSIAQQVMERMPPGHYGHMKPQDVGFEMPMPVVTWIGATTVPLDNGQKRLWLKGYIIPLEGGKNLKKFIQAKAINSISVYGTLSLMQNEETGVSDVLDIDLKSIDISGKLKEGLHSEIVKTAGEMEVPNTEPVPDSEPGGEQTGGTTVMNMAEVRANPELWAEIVKSVRADYDNENENKIRMKAAGEMAEVETITGMAGEQAVETVKRFKSFAGEMEAVLGVPTGSPLTAIIDSAKGLVEKSGVVDKLTSILKPSDGQDVTARAEEMVANVKAADNTAAIGRVKAKFDELTADIKNPVIKEMVADRFQNFLSADPAKVGDTYEADAMSAFTSQMESVKQTMNQRAESLIGTGRSAGEMVAYDSLGVGKGPTGFKDPASMTDEEYAKSLGYT